ncbi:MAG TPA: tRNA 2-thiouridine(34) synthase MnmA [Trueperaceae bacterium]
MENVLTMSPDARTPVAPRVFCAMSGGVDSSVAAALLQERGFEVTGSMMRFWPDDRPKGAFDLCCSPDAAYDARRIADAIEVPFYLLDYRDRFEDIVISPFVPSYEGGETPNPCVWCNRHIKFGAFIEKAQMLGCEFIATGHYVRRVDGLRGVELHRGADDDKDQTYFLWALHRDILPYLLFPLGDLSKVQVREMAEARGFVTADKPSSSGLCFITSTVRNYLKDFSTPRPGPVVDASDGYKTIGEHQGVQFYTIGQKKGLGLYHSHLQRYVIELQPQNNTVVVGTREMCHWQRLRAGRMNLLADPDEFGERVMAQTRYRQTPQPATFRLLDEDHFELVFDEPVFGMALGQSTVIYDGTRLLGGGVIEERESRAYGDSAVM